MNKLFVLIGLCFCINHAIAQEKALSNLRKLTSGGDNAEAYFSPDGKSLTLQITNKAAGIECDQIYKLDLNDRSENPLHRVSTGLGRTTCSYFMPDGKHIIYASTHMDHASCPAPIKPNIEGKYVWPIYPEYDILLADTSGKVIRKLTDMPGYDAEATVSPDGKHIVFTSMRSGDLELWTMNTDGSQVKQITNQLGYDGGAFFSPDSKKLVFRSSRPKTEKEIYEYKSLLKQYLVAPTEMEIYTCNLDGSGLKQITNLGKANWAPYYHPSGKKIIFSSNHHSTRGYDFQLYLIDTDGNNLQQITWESNFNAFPMFSPDGKKLVFSSNRQQGKTGETNVFIADWTDNDPNEFSSISSLKTHINYLASDKLEGRMTGSAGSRLAAQYLSNHFKNLKLKSMMDKTYLFPFEYTYQSDPHSTIATNVTPKNYKDDNIVSYLDNGAASTVIIGAHYDHLGRNENHHSTKPNSEGEIHNGADDNASGVAGVMELARMLSTNQLKEANNYVFILFSGEEDGLQGSKAFAAKVKDLYPGVRIMINMDMIGRLDCMKTLLISGIGTSPAFDRIVDLHKPAGFNLTKDSSGTGASDHTSFYLQKIPVLNFFTGSHSDYHKPSDDADKINYVGEKQIVDYIFNIILNLAKETTIPFAETKTNTTRVAARYKVTLGIMPDYSSKGDGLHIDAVIEGRPAAQAGLKMNDKILKIGACEVKEVYTYMECLADIKPGESKEVIYLRDHQTQKCIVQF